MTHGEAIPPRREPQIEDMNMKPQIKTLRVYDSTDTPALAEVEFTYTGTRSVGEALAATEGVIDMKPGTGYTIHVTAD